MYNNCISGVRELKQAIKNNILIFDDQLEFAQLLKERLSAIMKSAMQEVSITIIKDIQNYKQYITNTVLIIFLDIQMPISGFDIAKEINNFNIPIVFISNYETLVFDALLYQPFYFIRKKFLDEDLGKISNWLIKKAENQYYSFIENNINVSLNIDDILYIRSNGNYIEFITSNHIYKERKTLQSLISDRKFKQFLIPARGYLINYNHIAFIQKDIIVMRNDERLSISRNRHRSFYQAYYQLLGGEFDES